MAAAIAADQHTACATFAHLSEGDLLLVLHAPNSAKNHTQLE
jgi:hypothetical protein